MFKYSRNWLSKLAKEKIDYKDLDKNWLDLQGFEVATETKVNDDEIIELEVKANRPDMLSHLGVLREYYVFKNKGVLPTIKSKLNVENYPDISIKHEINTKYIDNISLIEIRNVDNTIKTPTNLKELLENLGVKSISPIVDISNYIMLEMGHPIHIYDLDKIDKIIYTDKSKFNKIVSLNGEEVEIFKDSLVIEDSKNPICLAGIVGSKFAEVDENTKNILIEAAHFDAIKIRVCSQKTHISTLASYRFERGVDSDETMNAALLTAEKVLEICGGKITGKYIRQEKKQPNIKTIKVDRTNKLLGTKLTALDIQNLLNKYYFKAEVQNANTVKVTCPDYRLDLEQEVDVIADIAQMYGYHNIVPTTANLSVKYEPNIVKQNSDILRNLMLSQGINECITYTFIHENSNKMLCLNEGDDLFSEIKILNPLSNKFALMRKNMLYSLLNTLIYNLSKNNECEPIFEIGTVFYKDSKTDTGYNQKTMLSVLLYGNKIEKGFGVDKNIPYDFYDIKAILELINSEFSEKLSLKEAHLKVLEENLGTEIYLFNKKIGYLGTVSEKVIKNFENGKLVKTAVQYLELCVDDLLFGTTKVSEISKFPSVKREYNLLVPNGVKFADYSQIIKNSSNEIRDIVVEDIYKGKGVKDGFVSVLVSIEYNSLEKTMQNEEIEKIENEMLYNLKKDYNIELKK